MIFRTANDLYAWTGHYNIDRPYANNGLNQPVSAGSVTFGHDARGNLAASGNSSYTYTAENRLANSGGFHVAYEPSGDAILLTYDSITGADMRFGYSSGDTILNSRSALAVVKEIR